MVDTKFIENSILDKSDIGYLEILDINGLGGTRILEKRHV